MDGGSETSSLPMSTDSVEMTQHPLRKRVREDQPNIETLLNQVDQLENKLKDMEDSHAESLRLVSHYSRENVLMEVERLMDIELECSICNEMFIEPTVLKCGHTFCHYCIHQAMDLEIQECPLCRTEIDIFPPARSIELRSFISKLHQMMPEEIQTSRQSVLKERAEISERLQQPPSPTSSTRSSRHPTTSAPAPPLVPVGRPREQRISRGQDNDPGMDSTSVPLVSGPIISFVIRPPPLPQNFEDLFTRRDQSQL